jgi:BASS family bile acid:Na+ symporter
MFVVVPAFAIAVAAIAPLPGPIKFAIVAMSVGPVPPILPFKQMKSGGEGEYAVGLLVAASIVSIVLTPLLVAAAGQMLGAEVSVGAPRIARVLLITPGVPLCAGLALNRWWPKAAAVIQTRGQQAGMLLLLVLLAVLVGVAWRGMLALLGDGGALAIAGTIAVGLLAGHVLGRGRDAVSLALASASRHPGVALSIAQMSYPEHQRPIMAAILLFLLITPLVTASYVRWARAHAQSAAAA